MVAHNETYPAESEWGSFKDEWTILWGDERVSLTTTYSTGLRPDPAKLLRLDIVVQDSPRDAPVSMELEFRGSLRLYGAATYQGQRPATADEKDELVDRILVLLPEIRRKSPEAFFFLHSSLQHAKRLPLLKPGRGV